MPAMDIHAEHVIVCVVCRSDAVRGNWHSEALWHGYCLMCGTRFWHER